MEDETASVYELTFSTARLLEISIRVRADSVRQK